MTSPDLSALLADPARAAELPVAEVPALLDTLSTDVARREVLKAVLAARLAGAPSNAHGAADHLLTLHEAAAVLHVKPDWLRRQKAVPFRVEVSPGQVRYSAHGIDRFIARRAGK